MARDSPEVVMICTRVMETWFNAEAEQLNAYILAYAQHNTNVILLEDFYMQDRKEILASTRLTTTQTEADYFRGSYIMDPQNLCRRKYQKSIQRDLGGPIGPRQQVSLTARRQAEDTLPEAWHKGLGSAPPYVADYESVDPKPMPTVTKEGSRVHQLVLVFQEKIAKVNGNVQGNAATMSLTRAEEIPQTKPQGIRHGILKTDDALWENSPEHEIWMLPGMKRQTP